jgi:3-hydroxyacyl-[acyl-carrier-protein] dehydratase
MLKKALDLWLMKNYIKIPYQAVPIVDEIKGNQWKQVEGTYTFDENLDFIRVILNIISDTGVILTETMAQIGLVCLGIFILDNNFTKNTQ